MPGWDGPLLASGHGVHRGVHRPAAEGRTSPSPGRFRVRADRARAEATASGRRRGALVGGGARRLLRVPGLPALLQGVRRGQQPGPRAVRRRRTSAGRGHGVTMAYIFDVASEYGAPAAEATLEHALSRPPEALVGFGLAGIEQARPGSAGVFRSVFAAAIAA